MNRYDPHTSRLASGLADVVMTAATIGLLVVLPSQLGAERDVRFAPAALTAALHAQCDRVAGSACIATAGRAAAAAPPTRIVESGCRQPG